MLPCTCACSRNSPSAMSFSICGFVVKWWIPEHWAFVDALPKTSVGKFDKRALRRLHFEGHLEVITL